MGRAPCCEKVGLKKGRWTGEEDDILTKYIQANGEGSWRSLPKNAGLLRCGKSCRLRWINYLRYDLKRGNISSQEEDIIIKLHASLGNKWSLIASQLPGRTDNEIKNYWNSHLSRKIDTFRRPRSEPLPIIMNLGTKESKKKGGRTSRAAMKKNKTSHTTNNKIGKSSPEIVDLESVVPLPSTPTLEKETLPRAIISRQEKQGEMEMRNLVMPTSYQEVGGEGMLGSSEEREIIVMSNDGEEREKRNLMLYCPTDDQESSELLGPQESLESGLLTFHDINTCSEEAEKNITMVSGDQERESGVVMSCISSNGDLSSNGESGGGGGGWFSCSSTTPYLENGRIGWEWGGFVHHENLWENGKDQEQEIEQEEMLSWLWDTSDNINGGGETQNLGGGIMNSEKHEALVTWLLS